MTEDILFETKDLCYSYHSTKKTAIENINMKIGRRKKTVILGANGAGKSTLFYHFNGVFKPKSGQILYNGVPLEHTPDKKSELRSDVAVVLQNPDDQIFSATVEEDVAFGALNSGLSYEEVDKRIDEALFMVGLTEYRMKPTSQLSYGQRKRVAFAGAIATHPKVLILDEPTAGLDPQMAQELMEIADQLHHMGTSVIISTHDVDLAYAWADEIHVLRNGKLIYSGISEGFYSNLVEVALSGLIPPSMFGINENLFSLSGKSCSPYPRTRAQLLSKMSSPDVRVGTLYTVPVDDRFDQSMIDAAMEVAGSGSAVGIYGTDTRKLAYAAADKLDYVFNGVENCITETLLGRNAILGHDRELSDLVKKQVDDIEGFGARIRIVDLGQVIRHEV